MLTFTVTISDDDLNWVLDEFKPLNEEQKQKLKKEIESVLEYQLSDKDIISDVMHDLFPELALDN